jgi:hypothetical protein
MARNFIEAGNAILARMALVLVRRPLTLVEVAEYEHELKEVTGMSLAQFEIYLFQHDDPGIAKEASND